uniref:Receptor activity-modifying protein 1 n=1 Tax=Esox lucius TaxID=8010 RepID=A0AAY5K0F0_ESOLU
MIILLLFPVLVLGDIELQNSSSSWIANHSMTNSTTFENNGQTELQNSVSSNITFKDGERFQDQEHFHVFHDCNENLLELYSNITCWGSFHHKMEYINMEHWCNWDKVIRPYSELTKCMEFCSGYLGCYYPNQVVQDFFIKIHSHYFQACPVKEAMFPDAPSDVVLTLTLIPVGLIPILIFLVVWNNKGMD